MNPQINKAPSIKIANHAKAYISDLQKLLEAIDLDQLQKAAKILEKAHNKGNKVFIIGNGGSASTASHMACDLSKGVRGDKGNSKKTWGFKAISLGDNTATLTAWTNDTDYTKAYEEQIKNLADKKDVLIAISSSGNSPNILKCTKSANQIGLKTITISGFRGGKLAKLGNVNIITNSNDYGKAEDIQLTINHILTAYFSRKLNKE